MVLIDNEKQLNEKPVGPPFTSEPLNKYKYEVSTDAIKERIVALRQESTTNKRSWVALDLERLETEYKMLYAELESQLVKAIVLGFRKHDGTHLLDLNGSSQKWIKLSTIRFFEVESNVPWVCGTIPFHVRDEHEKSSCQLRLVSCSLECGQLIPFSSLQNHLEKRCPHRKMVCRLGCSKAFTFQELRNHEDNDCTYRQVACTFCNSTMKSLELEHHIFNFCKDFPKSCRLGCGLMITANQNIFHEENECNKRLLPCAQCKENVWAEEMSHHVKWTCTHRPYGQCDNKCGVSLLHYQVADHLSYQCENRTIECNACGESVLFSGLVEHQKMFCPKRNILCQKGCGMIIQEEHVDKHEKIDCLKRFVYCENGCGAEVFIMNQLEHEKAHCQRRQVSCPNHCSDYVRSCELAFHLFVCDRRLVPCGSSSDSCARPLLAWVQRGADGTNYLDNCKTHKENGFMWAVRYNDIKLCLAFGNKVSSIDFSI